MYGDEATQALMLDHGSTGLYRQETSWTPESSFLLTSCEKVSLNYHGTFVLLSESTNLSSQRF